LLAALALTGGSTTQHPRKHCSTLVAALSSSTANSTTAHRRASSTTTQCSNIFMAATNKSSARRVLERPLMRWMTRKAWPRRGALLAQQRHEAGRNVTHYWRNSDTRLGAALGRRRSSGTGSHLLWMLSSASSSSLLTWVVKTRAARSALMATQVGASSPRSSACRRGCGTTQAPRKRGIRRRV
jgi:hypothetical protein